GGGNQKIRRCPIARDRNVPDHGDPEERFHVRVMRMWLERIPEKDQNVDFALADLRSGFFISAPKPALHTRKRKIKFSLKEVPCRAGRHELVATQGLPIEFCPGQEILLLIVMRHNGNGFFSSHGESPIPHDFSFFLLHILGSCNSITRPCYRRVSPIHCLHCAFDTREKVYTSVTPTLGTP